MLGSDFYTVEEEATATGPQTNEASEMKRHKEPFQATVLLGTQLDTLISKYA